MKLIDILPQILPAAITWAETQAKEVALVGSSLDAYQISLAKRVGVRNPERIRVKMVERLPIPEEPLLRMAAVETGLLGPGMAGLTLGYSILICHGQDTVRLVSHECRHVHQYENFGSIAAFLPVYLQQIATVGYANAELEIDARAHEIFS